MQRSLVAVMLVVVGEIAFAGGCAPKKMPASTGAAPNPPPPTMNSPQARAHALSQRARDLRRIASELPGPATADNRRLAAEAFDAASGAVALLAGPAPSGALRQQIHILDDTRNFLKSGPAGVSPEPAIDSGLRALEQALTSIRDELFPDNPRLAPSLEALAGHVKELDTVRGPTHALVVGQAFTAVGNAVSTMADELTARNQSPTTTSVAGTRK